MFQIGQHTIDSQVILAPMAGVTDLPFRRLCKRLGAGMVVSEMVTSDTRLWHSRKSSYRLQKDPDNSLNVVQIAGGDPEMMAEAASVNAANGAHIIDINMGCPAKKVCNKAAGSALLKDEALVKDILQATVAAVDVPVTLKIRTGWDCHSRNGESIARIAEDAGIQALAVHGRTRACGYKGEAEYDTIARIRQAIDIPLFANGDIHSPEKARQVLEYTGADAVMLGRPAQGNPWIFREISHYLKTGKVLPSPTAIEVRDTLLEHLSALYHFYGDFAGVRIARKHVGWYLKNNQGTELLQNSALFRKEFNQIEETELQQDAIRSFFIVPGKANAAA
ncbi:tRNA dihydrouridine synthase DusB [Amphritea sp. 1_MG-2023]|uniref:tRNA dihydrouridine synthase DusB n=1 Tax=Amphritea sp. 1_MG-2023 TaxID=3062670 RepID=UPI0026E317D9|nr:tRNA dihydrouridine synthase DusB [Amphritea sp. 1_MG-2023]MDO6564419.1 tRNA dihydrouridine synthase DusB [Amphritea sp. 1_MG-2023]